MEAAETGGVETQQGLSLAAEVAAQGAHDPQNTAVLKLKGLPFSAQENDVREFFAGFQIVKAAIHIGADGRPSGLVRGARRTRSLCPWAGPPPPAISCATNAWESLICACSSTRRSRLDSSFLFGRNRAAPPQLVILISALRGRLPSLSRRVSSNSRAPRRREGP